MNKWLFGTIICLGIALYASIQQINKTKKQLDVAMANIKNYDSELNGEKNKNSAYQLTIDQLKYYQDSILKKLDDTRKELKIKDKKLQSMQYVSTVLTRVDTVTLRDTLFKEPSFALDTLIGDKWYNLRLGLKYPSTIAVKPEFNSEKHIIVSTKKETVNPPKKFFLFRWFQRKHTILQVNVVEKNPYVESQDSKYVEILK